MVKYFFEVETKPIWINTEINELDKDNLSAAGRTFGVKMHATECNSMQLCHNYHLGQLRNDKM